MSALKHVLHDNQKHALAAGLPAKGLKQGPLDENGVPVSSQLASLLRD